MDEAPGRGTEAMHEPANAAVDLVAVLVAVSEGEPRVMTIESGSALPSGPFETGHRSLQSGLRAWVERQTHHPLGYVEQLYTFADRDRGGGEAGRRTISISYLGLTRESDVPAEAGAGWRDWYDYFPWEDRRSGIPAMFAQSIAPGLARWSEAAPSAAAQQERRQRAAIHFGLDGAPWNEELVLQRYELLYEANLVPEATETVSADNVAGRRMSGDHRRILATGIARLRAKIKYRPVVFELMQPAFTLYQLQRSVEALAGLPVHKQNFRRLVEQQELVEETGATTSETGGRPARLYRFRHQVLAERAAAGTKLPLTRA